MAAILKKNIFLRFFRPYNQAKNSFFYILLKFSGGLGCRTAEQ